VIPFGLAVHQYSGRLAPVRHPRVIEHYIGTARQTKRSERSVMRDENREPRAMVRDLAKPADLFPDITRIWGDEDNYSLQLGPRRMRLVELSLNVKKAGSLPEPALLSCGCGLIRAGIHGALERGASTKPVHLVCTGSVIVVIYQLAWSEWAKPSASSGR